MSDSSSSALPRQVADAYVDAFIELDPISGTYLGVAASSRRLPDFSPPARSSWPRWRGTPSRGSTARSSCPVRPRTPSAAAAGCCGNA